MGDFSIGGRPISGLERLYECHLSGGDCDSVARNIGLEPMPASGSTRDIYGAGDEVVKVATPYAGEVSWGLEANLRESFVWRNGGADLRRDLAAVSTCDPSGRWLYMRRARRSRCAVPDLERHGLIVDDVEGGRVDGRCVAIDYAGVSVCVLRGTELEWRHPGNR